jgi:mannose-1-phosphate guanylyltransferase
MEHAVILAGGSGTRLWPLSRRRFPKQLLPLIGGRSLLSISRERLVGLFAPEATWVLTSQNYIDQVAQALPDIPRDNLVGEPEGRDTANAISLAAGLIHQRDPDGIMAVFTADHVITPQERFASAIRTGLDAARDHADALITFGIVPDSPHTGFGYLHRGETISAGLYRVAAFKEKPTRQAAEQMIRTGEYYWNSGMFAWRVSTIRDQLAEQLPANAAALDEICRDWNVPQRATAARAAFARLAKISIDYGVMEKAPRVLVVPMDCRWRDVGSWPAVAEHAADDAAHNRLIAGDLVTLDSEGNLVQTDGDHLVALLGVRDLIVIHTPDATLICHKDHVERIRELAALREARFGERFE